jgi:hypothetical protein
MDKSTTRKNVLTVNLSNPLDASTGSFGSVKVKDVAGDHLAISLRRTVRVPDNGKTYGLPPDCGSFPLYNVLDYEKKLPADLVAKGGAFFPIYRMWYFDPTTFLCGLTDLNRA